LLALTNIKYTEVRAQVVLTARRPGKNERMILRYLLNAWGIVWLVLALMGAPLMAQEKADTPQPQSQPSDQQQKKQEEKQKEAPVVDPHDREANDEVPKRIFWIIPNFMTYNDQPENQGPLTTKEKFDIAWHQFWDVSAHVGNLLQASISQAADGLPHYGQGWGPFAERYAAQEGDQFTGSMLIYGVLPTAFHQDPRYFRKGRGKTWSRVAYAATRVVIARTDSGKSTVNASQLLGQFGQASISLLYYPQQDRNFTGVVSGWCINQGYNIGWNQLKEFTPDLGAFLKRHSKKKSKGPEVQDSRSPLYESP
jgi:hypothetical protein